MQTSSIKGLTADQARSATECTKCGAPASTLYSTSAVGQRVAAFEASKIIAQRTFETVPVLEAEAPSHAHCLKCATSYRKRLERRAAGKARGDQAKARKANLGGADCMCVATSLATGLRYDRTESLMKRVSGQYNGKTKGPAMFECPTIVKRAAEKRGLEAQSVLVQAGMSPAQVRDAYGHHGNLIIVATYGRNGHAMPVVKGTLHNAHAGWDTRSKVTFAWLLTKPAA